MSTLFQIISCGIMEHSRFLHDQIMVCPTGSLQIIVRHLFYSGNGVAFAASLGSLAEVGLCLFQDLARSRTEVKEALPASGFMLTWEPWKPPGGTFTACIHTLLTDTPGYRLKNNTIQEHALVIVVGDRNLCPGSR